MKIFVANYVTDTWYAANVQDDPEIWNFASPSVIMSLDGSEEWVQSVIQGATDEMTSWHVDNEEEVPPVTVEDDGWVGKGRQVEVTCGEEHAYIVIEEREV
jgi:hypothetical protein